jgi:hypothetical protein
MRRTSEKLRNAIGETVCENNGGIEQIIGREGETASLLSRCLLNSELRVAGFAPRQFNRYAAARGLVVC